jgi:PAS domain-containing protein
VTVELPLVGPNGATATITLNSRDADGSLYSTLFERARTLLNLSSTDNIVYQFTDSEGDSFDVTEHESFDRLLDYIMDDLEHSPGGKLTLSIKTDERKRRVSEASLRYTVIEAPVVMTDNDGTLVFVNKTFLTLVGGSAEQYMRNRVESILVESLAEYRHISSSAESTVSTALITSHGPVPVAVKLSHEGEFWVWTLTVLSSPAPAILKEATTSDDVSDAADFVIRSASSSLSDLPIVGLGAGPL